MEEVSISSINPDLDDYDQDVDYATEFLDDEDDIQKQGEVPEFDETDFEADPLSSHQPPAKRQRSENIFDFQISCFKKDFRGQHHDKGRAEQKIIVKDWRISGDSPEEVVEQIFELVRNHIRREVIVYDDKNIKRVKWASNETLHSQDMNRFILFKDVQRKRVYRVAELLEKPDILVKWRDRTIDVYLHIYSLSISNNKLFELVKILEAPPDKDRAGAQSNKSFQDLIQELKQMHPLVAADSFVWSNWAEHVEAAPGYMRDHMKQNPPEDVESHLRSAPDDDSAILEENRRGLCFAQTVIRAMESNIQDLKEHSVSLLAAARIIEERVSTMEVKLKSYKEMLASMQRSLSPAENELSLALARSVTDADDVDHM